MGLRNELRGDVLIYGAVSGVGRSAPAHGVLAVLGVILLLLSTAVQAQGADPQTPPTPTPTPTPTPSPSPEASGEALEAPTPEPTPGQEVETVPEATPTPTPESDDEGAAKPVEGFNLNAYPETARLPPKQKWRSFKQGVRGLLVWDFFDSRLTIRAQARLQVDGTAARADSSLQEVTGALGESLDVRRLQLFAQGTIAHRMRYSISFTFGGSTGFGDIFVEGRDHGLNIFGYRVGQFRVGQFQEPFSFEQVMSSYYTGFLERSLPVWTFSPGNNIGYMVYDTTKSKRMTWALGFFSWGQANEANASNSVLSVTSRVTWLPVYRDNGLKLFHLGGSISSRTPSGSVQYRSRPEARFVPYFVDTGQFDASRINLYGIEVVGLNGPFSFQSEAILSEVKGTDYGNLSLWGGYVEVGYFLTDDHRSYDTGMGVFSRVTPKRDHHGFFRKKPGGALELTGRVSNIDLTDGGLNGGQMIDYSLGVNWYMSPTTAVKFNYIYSDVKDGGHANILVLRFQFRPIPVPGWR